MCGIAGMQYFNGQIIENSDIDRITAVIAHRGPDKYLKWISDDRSVGFGHQRLSIIDLSDLADQPMHYLDRYVITFNGEIYNFIELREELKGMGYTFKSNTDTEIIPAAYDAWKENCLQHFDGMFAFALFDKNEKKMFCARDRFGEKPFFYNSVPGKHFVFGSEIKVILKWQGDYKLDEEMFFLFLTYYLHENPRDKKQCFFEGIKRLEAAHYLVVDRFGNISTKRYWEISKKPQFEPILICDAVNKYTNLLENSVSKRLRSDVPVGTSLSGGLDSSTLAHIILGKNTSGLHQFKTFTARFDCPSKDEGHYVGLLTNKYDFISYQKIINEFVIVNDLKRMIWHQEQPIASASPLAQWEVMKLAKRHHAIVLLDGQGADETNAGYTHYFRPYFKELIARNLLRFIGEYRMFLKNQVNHDIFGYNFLLDLFMPSLRRQLAQAHRNFILPHHLNDLGDGILEKFRYYEPPFNSIRNLYSSLHNSTFNYGLEKLLSFADRNSMAFSIEVRLPFLDHKLVEFLFSLPSSLKLNQGWTKYLLRLSYCDRLPSEISWRKDKLGYEPPQEIWMQNPVLIKRAEKSIESLKEKGFIKKPDKNKTWIYFMADTFLDTFFYNGFNQNSTL